MWYAGIDWADEHHDVLVIDEAGRQVSSLRVTHTKEGLNQLTTFLENIAGSATKEQMACIIETSHGLLIAALLDAGCAVYPVNPKMVDRRRRPSGAKTDAIDAYLLAKLGRSEFNDLRRLQPDSGLVQELKALTRDQDSLIQSQTRQVGSAHGLPQSVLPGGFRAVYQIAAALLPGVLADVPDSRSGPECLSGRDDLGAQSGWAHQSQQGCSAHLAGASAPPTHSRCHHDTYPRRG
jgi:transposase